MTMKWIIINSLLVIIIVVNLALVVDANYFPADDENPIVLNFYTITGLMLTVIWCIVWMYMGREDKQFGGIASIILILAGIAFIPLIWPTSHSYHYCNSTRNQM